MFFSDIRVVSPALPIAIGSISPVSLGKVGHLSISRSLAEELFEGLRLQMPLGIEAHQGVSGPGLGEESRKELFDPPAMGPLAPPLLSRQQTNLPPDGRLPVPPAARENLWYMVVSDVLA